MNNTPWRMGVLIPARDEEELIGRCLHSVLAAKACVGPAAPVDIVVMSDSSTDRTEDIARAILGKAGWVGSTNFGTVGLARRKAAEKLLERGSHPLSSLWIANTDADCIVPDTWLADQLQLAQRGIEAFAGTVDVDSFEDHGPEVACRFKSSYFIAADGAHPHVHGANLGFRADVYLRAGGWAALPTAEDHDLWGRLSDIGARTCSTSRIEVKTSGRRTGRAPHGFAAALAAHNETAA